MWKEYTDKATVKTLICKAKEKWQYTEQQFYVSIYTTYRWMQHNRKETTTHWINIERVSAKHTEKLDNMHESSVCTMALINALTPTTSKQTYNTVTSMVDKVHMSS
jgi:hypothetical protein